MARGFAAAGARVTLNGRDEFALNSAVEQLNGEGYQATGFVCDVTDSEQLKTNFAKVGAVDILVNNAGIQIRAPFLGRGIIG